MLAVDDVEVALGGRTVLRSTSLRVEAGEHLGVLGPNGAGKTTLLRAVLGLVPVRSGAITLDGRPARELRHRFAYVPQRHELDWSYPASVWDVAATGALARRRWFARPGDEAGAVRTALARVGLTGLSRRPVGELSGGQRQRVLVARALVGGGDVLLLDEPFVALDAPTQLQLAELFGDLAASGHTVVMTNHDLGGAMRTCSRIVLVRGTVLGDGAPRDLAGSPAWGRTFGRDDLLADPAPIG